jgi:hypothetical protein
MNKEHWHCAADRYKFDFSEEYRRGWKQYDTRQDAWYYGVWYNPVSMQTLCYAEGDIYLNTCEAWKEFLVEMKGMDSFHGSVPACAIAGDDITVDLKIKNAVHPDIRGKGNYKHMGKMKQFGQKLAYMVYERKLSDKRIIEELNVPGVPDEEWIQEQINIVRKNPQIYRSMANAQ